MLKISDNDFEEEVLKKEGITIVDFYADWCGPCKTIIPILDTLVEKNPKVHLVKVNVDENSEITEKYSIRGIPTLLFFKDGEIKATKIGIHSLVDLVNVIKEL